MNLNVYYWTSAEQAEVLRVGDEVTRGIKEALDEAAIDIPFPTRVVLFHNETPERNGHAAGDGQEDARRGRVSSGAPGLKSGS